MTTKREELKNEIQDFLMKIAEKETVNFPKSKKEEYLNSKKEQFNRIIDNGLSMYDSLVHTNMTEEKAKTKVLKFMFFSLKMAKLF